MSREITLYSKTPCVQCDASKRELEKVGVDFKKDGDLIVIGDTTYIQADATNSENLEFIMGLNHKMAPVMTVVVDGELVDHWSGFQPDKIQEHAA